MPKGRGIYYNRTNTCDNIKKDGKKCENKLVPKNAYREHNKEGDLTGKWLCRNCYVKDYDHERRLTDRRTCNVKPNSSNVKGDKFQKLTCKWLGVDDLNIVNDNYITPIDHSRHPILGILQTKGKLYDSRNGYWHFEDLEREWNKKFDYMICYCANKDGKIIERIYKFPKEKIIGITGITIYNNDNYHWYDKYRVKDKEDIKKVNSIFMLL